MYHLALFFSLILLNPFYVHAVCRDIGDRSCLTDCYGESTCVVDSIDKPTCPRGQLLGEINLTKDGCIDDGRCSIYEPLAHIFKCTFRYQCVSSLSLYTLAFLVCA